MKPQRPTMPFAILALALAGCTSAASTAGTRAVPAVPSAPSTVAVTSPSSANPAGAPSSSAFPVTASDPVATPPAITPPPASAPVTGAPVVATGARLVRATTARSLDAAGNPAGETNLFESATDRSIILAIGITGGTPGTTVGYRRYFENTFIDGKNTNPTRPGDGLITFGFSKAAGSTYPAGAYLVRILIDGRDVGTARFTVR